AGGGIVAINRDDTIIKSNKVYTTGSGGKIGAITFLGTSNHTAGIAVMSTAGTPSAVISGNTIEGLKDIGQLEQSYLWRGIWTQQVQSTIGGVAELDGNTVEAMGMDLTLQFPSWGKVLVQNNAFNGAGIDVVEPNATVGVDGIEITENT